MLSSDKMSTRLDDRVSSSHITILSNPSKSPIKSSKTKTIYDPELLIAGYICKRLPTVEKIRCD